MNGPLVVVSKKFYHRGADIVQLGHARHSRLRRNGGVC
jgi:hypothetical protein